MNILITGVTGYVGGRLVNRFVAKGQSVRILVRDATRVSGRDWNNVSVFQGDVLDYQTLLPALKDVDVAYYLVHSMAAGVGFFDRDIRGAANFGRAAAVQGVKRIIYMSGLGSDDDRLSPHLRSRHQTGEELRKSGVPVTEFRAAQIIGSGSVSFEMIRYITERMPIIISPKFVRTKSQPIAVRDVLSYLEKCIDIPESTGRILEIGGPDILGYDQMLLMYAQVRGLKRRIMVMPLLTPGMCAYFLPLITPIPGNIGRPLIDGLRNEVVVHDQTARQLFEIPLITYRMALELALERKVEDKVETVWSGAISSLGQKEPEVVKLTNTQGMIMEKREIVVQASAANAFRAIISLGGENGWLYANPLWWLRGVLDTLVGGVGFRGRRCYLQLRIGDSVDFWRVEDYVDQRLLRLRSEMKMPGKGWLQFEISPIDNQNVLIRQIAYYEPKGLLGHLYWYVLYPIHKVIFSGMIKELARQVKLIG